MICGIDYMAGVFMEENILADKVEKLLQYIESSMCSPTNIDNIIITCMQSRELLEEIIKTYHLITPNQIKRQMYKDWMFRKEILYSYFVLKIEDLLKDVDYTQINFCVDKAYLNELLAKTNGRVLWSAQIKCSYSALGVKELIYLPAMYLVKTGWIKQNINFITENDDSVTLEDITLKRLKKLENLDSYNIPEEESNKANAIQKYFGDILRPRKYFGNDVESNYSRQLYDDLDILSTYIRHLKGNETHESLTRDDLYKKIMTDPGIAKFYYIYKLYILWKYQKENSREPMDITSIGYLTYAEAADNYEGQRGMINREPYHSIHFSKLIPNENILKTEKRVSDNVSLGKLIGFTSGNGIYTDELYTLLLVNGNMAVEELIPLSFIWHSHLWGSAYYIKSLFSYELREMCANYLSELAVRKHAIEFLRPRLKSGQITSYVFCLWDLFFYHTNKHGQLIHAIREEIINSLDISKVPTEKRMYNLYFEIERNPDAFIKLFSPVIKREKNKNELIFMPSTNHDENVACEAAENLLSSYIYGDNFTRSQQDEMKERIKDVTPFLCSFFGKQEIKYSDKVNWIYCGCIGLYFMCKIIPILDKRLGLKLNTLDVQKKNTNLSKKTIDKLLRSIRLGLSESYYQILQSYPIKKSSYTRIRINEFSTLINIENYNSVRESAVPLVGESENKTDLALVRSIVIFEIILLFVDLYECRVPSWARDGGIEELKDSLRQTEKGNVYAHNDIKSYLLNLYR